MSDARPEKAPEFDAYAHDYKDLLRDPLREKFAGENLFFAEQKLQVIRSFFRSLGRDTQSLNWLDVGCGFGELLRMGRPMFASVSGCDPAKEMLRGCGDLDVLLQPSHLQIPFNSSSFDFVTAVCVYHHIPVEQRSIMTAEIARVARPGGILALIEHNPWNPVTRLIVSRTPIDRNAVLLTAGECKRLVRDAGATVVSTRYFLVLPKPIYKHASWVETGLASLPLGGQYAVFSQLR